MSDRETIHPTGLIVGRFDPPHLGHSFLIESAAEQCERLVVFVNSRHSDAAPGTLRASWLAELHPAVRVIEVRHDLDTDWSDESLWARWIDLFRSHWPHQDGPAAVFSSEGYSAELARRLGADPVVVDEERVNVPISATMIRVDPAAHLDQLALPVRGLDRGELAVTAGWAEALTKLAHVNGSLPAISQASNQSDAAPYSDASYAVASSA